MDSQYPIAQLQLLPPHLREEVFDFIGFLYARHVATPSLSAPAPIIPVFGSAKGKYIMAPDFEEPLEDFKEYME